MMKNILQMNSLSQPSPRTKRENPVKQTIGFERDGDGWWANRHFGEDNILGHGSTKEEALMDLEHQIVGFVNFLKSTGRTVPEPLMTPADRSRPISKA